MTPSPFDRVAAAYPTLASIPVALAADLSATSHTITAAPKDVLFEPGAPCAGLPLLLRGTVRVSRPLASGQEVPLYRIGPGDLCALSLQGLIARTTHVARAQAIDEVRGVILQGDVVMAIIDADAAFRHHVLSALGSRVQGLVGVLEQVAAVRLDERLARMLVERGPVLSATHQSLADELGTAREVVSRILEGFQLRGAVRLRRGRVELVDRTRLGPAPRSSVQPALPSATQAPAAQHAG